MIRALVVAGALLAATPALAGDVVLTIRNLSGLTISSLNTFPIDGDGDPVEDNLGALTEDVPPHTTVTLALDGRCGPTLISVGITSQGDESDMEFRLNTCKSRVLILNDAP